MFVQNRKADKKDIELRSFDGYLFSIPYGVSWIWDKAGEHLIKNIFKVESKGGQDNYGLDNGHGIPDLLVSNKVAWVKGGKRLAQAQRFHMNADLIPREALIKIAQARGVDDGRILQWLSDKQVDKSEIADAINSLPIPEEIRYPAELNESETLDE